MHNQFATLRVRIRKVHRRTGNYVAVGGPGNCRWWGAAGDHANQVQFRVLFVWTGTAIDKLPLLVEDLWRLWGHCGMRDWYNRDKIQIGTRKAHVPITSKLTLLFLVGDNLKSTRHRKFPASFSVTGSIIRTAGPVFLSRRALFSSTSMSCHSDGVPA